MIRLFFAIFISSISLADTHYVNPVYGFSFNYPESFKPLELQLEHVLIALADKNNSQTINVIYNPIPLELSTSIDNLRRKVLDEYKQVGINADWVNDEINSNKYYLTELRDRETFYSVGLIPLDANSHLIITLVQNTTNTESGFTILKKLLASFDSERNSDKKNKNIFLIVFFLLVLLLVSASYIIYQRNFRSNSKI